MWIVKNESSDMLALTELGIDVAGKEYIDLDARGRDLAESAETIREALAQGKLRTVSKTATEIAMPPPPAKPASNVPDVLRDLTQRPPLPGLLVPAGPPGEPLAEAPLGVRESFLQRQKRRKEDAEEQEASPQTLAMRAELDRFRKTLLSDIQKLLDDYLRP